MNNKFQFGIVVDVIPLDVLSKGWEYFEIPASMHCSALFCESEWQEQKALYKADGRPTPVSAFMLGPGSTWKGASGQFYNPDVIKWSLEIQFKRMAELGIKWAGAWGGHFRCQDGFCRSKAIDQAISSINVMADLAEKYGMEIALEPQAEPDTLFPKYLEGVAFAKLTGRRSVKVMADLNYFLELEQPLEDILKEPELCLNVHIQGDGGAQPNVGKRDEILIHLFNVLKEAGYDKGVSAACPWVPTNGAKEVDYKFETDFTLKYLEDLREKVYR